MCRIASFVRITHLTATMGLKVTQSRYGKQDCMSDESYLLIWDRSREDWERIMNSTFYSLDVIQLQLSLSEGPGPMVSDDLEAFTSYKAWVNNKRKKKRKKEPLRVYYSL